MGSFLKELFATKRAFKSRRQARLCQFHYSFVACFQTKTNKGVFLTLKILFFIYFIQKRNDYTISNGHKTSRGNY
jgi:hypothetical protein